MNLQLSHLDEEELLQLGIQASQKNLHDQAITYLKETLQRNPANGVALYLLGAEHAQMGLYQRAIEEMQEAVDLSPELHTARFQLGLLYLTQAIPEAALNTLEPLMNLGEESYLAHFAKGLIHLMRDEFESCTRALQQGIALNRDNLALNADMQKILFAISQHQAAEEPSAQTQTQNRVESEDKKAATSLWLSAYQQEDNEH